MFVCLLCGFMRVRRCAVSFFIYALLYLYLRADRGVCVCVFGLEWMARAAGPFVRVWLGGRGESGDAFDSCALFEMCGRLSGAKCGSLMMMARGSRRNEILGYLGLLVVVMGCDGDGS